MAPSLLAVAPSSAAAWEQASWEQLSQVTHSAKKRKLDRCLQEEEAHPANLRQPQAHQVIQEHESLSVVPPHPQGIRPSGNAFDARVNIRYRCGTFALLPDELILQLLEYLDCVDLVRMGGTCKALYGFATSEELWKTLFIEYVAIVFTMIRSSSMPPLACLHFMYEHR